MKILIADDFFAGWKLIKVDTEEVAIDYIKSLGENAEGVKVLLSDIYDDDLKEAQNNADKVLYITDYMED